MLVAADCGETIIGQAASCFHTMRILAREGFAWLFLLAFLPVSALGISGQEPASPMRISNPEQPLNLDLASVADLARTRSWLSKQAHQDATTADAMAKRAESLRWGRVDFQSQYLRFNEPIQILSPIPAPLVPVLGLKALATPLAPQDNLHVDLQAGLPLFTGGKITSVIHQAQAGSRAAADMASDTDDDVVLEAERGYLSVLLTREAVEMNEAALRSYKEHLEHAQSAFRQGTAAKYDIIRAEAAVAEQEKRLTDAKNQSALAEAALRSMLALDDATPVNIGGNLFEISEDIDLNQAMSAAVQSSPILRALKEKIAAGRSAVHAQKADYLPHITAIAGRELVTNKLAQTDPTWFVGARATLTLFDGGERQGRVAEARSQLHSSDFEYHHAEDQIRLAVRSAYLDLQSRRQQLASARKTAQLAAESLRLATKRFEVGTGTSLEVLDANVSLTGAQIGVQQALYGIDLSYLSIHRYQGDISEVSTRIQK
jgi:outer membrane protein TolC